MAMIYASNLHVGNRLIVSEGNIQEVVAMHPGGSNGVSLLLKNGKTFIIGTTSLVPVVSSKFDTNLSIEAVYNQVLDDNMSLIEFTEWCSAHRNSKSVAY